MRCPSCRGDAHEPFLSRDDVAAEFALRDAFFSARIDGWVPPPERKDRTDVGHAEAAEIRVCRACGILVRIDDCVDWRGDPYAPYVMEQMLRTSIGAFAAKEATYRPLLPDGAKVVEIGSYVGAFLHVAREWGWDAIGADPGEETSRFARAHGYVTQTATLQECRFDGASFDGVFIWNCFEQIGDLDALLAETRRVLKPGGLVVIRTPNALFYSVCTSMLHARGAIDPLDPFAVALGHANLLGFPHLYGFGAASLDRLVTRAGFAPLFRRSDRHIAPSTSRLTVTAKREIEELDGTLTRVDDAIARIDAEAVFGPWFEAAYRRA